MSATKPVAPESFLAGASCSAAFSCSGVSTGSLRTTHPSPRSSVGSRRSSAARALPPALASPILSSPGRSPSHCHLWFFQGPGNLHAVGSVPALLQLPHGRQHEENYPLAQVCCLPYPLGDSSFLSLFH